MSSPIVYLYYCYRTFIYLYTWTLDKNWALCSSLSILDLQLKMSESYALNFYSILFSLVSMLSIFVNLFSMFDIFWHRSLSIGSIPVINACGGKGGGGRIETVGSVDNSNRVYLLTVCIVMNYLNSYCY